MTKDNPLNVVVTESALPYVALVLYAAQQVEGEQPEFARQLVEAARYVEGLMLAKRKSASEIRRLKKHLDLIAPMICPECGPHRAIDEDGCCVTCGADCTAKKP